MNANIIRARMAECGLTQGDTAKAIGISLSRFNAKLNNKNGAEFSLPDAIALKKVLKLTTEQIEQIFFDEKVS